MVTLGKTSFKLLSLEESAASLFNNQSIKAVLLFDLNIDDIAILKIQLEQLIQNQTIWFCATGAFAARIEDAIDIIIEDFAAQYGDIYLNAVTVSDTDIRQAIFEFLHFPDYNPNEIGYVLYDAQKYKRQHIIEYLCEKSA